MTAAIGAQEPTPCHSELELSHPCDGTDPGFSEFHTTSMLVDVLHQDFIEFELRLMRDKSVLNLPEYGYRQSVTIEVHDNGSRLVWASACDEARETSTDEIGRAQAFCFAWAKLGHCLAATTNASGYESHGAVRFATPPSRDVIEGVCLRWSLLDEYLQTMASEVAAGRESIAEAIVIMEDSLAYSSHLWASAPAEDCIEGSAK